MLDRHEFVVHGGVESPFAAVVSALRSGFIVEEGNPRTVRRTWLDTFDWRLHRAGLTLEHLTCAGSDELSLSPGPRLAVSGRPGAWTWPGRVDGLNAGALGKRLEPIAGIRVLLAVAETEGTVRDLRLMNKDQKTVVRVVSRTCRGRRPTAGRLAPRVTVAAVRGYGSQGKAGASALASVPEIMATGESRLDAALAAMDRRAGDYTGRVEVSLDGSAPAGAAVAAVLLRLLEMLEANVDGVIRDLDTEFLHDLRISVRRTRSGLTLAGDTLPAGLAARFAGEFKWPAT